MTPPHPQSRCSDFSQPSAVFHCLRSEPASLDRLPQALAYRRLCPAYAEQIFLFTRQGKERKGEKSLIELPKFLIRKIKEN